MHQAPALLFAVRIPTIGKYIGQLCLAMGLLTLVPLTMSIFLGETLIAQRYTVVVAVLWGGGYPLSRLKGIARIQTNEAMVVTASMFLIAPLLMSYPMSAAGIPYVDALFEAISAATTTGLTTVDTVEDKPQVFLFARAWMQWYGGLGIIVLSLAILVQPGFAAKTLAVAENVEEDLAGGTRAHARNVLITYTVITMGGIGLLWFLQDDLFTAVLYSFSAVSTGGFAPRDASLAAVGSPAVQWSVTLLCLLGASSLPFYYNIVVMRRSLPFGLLQFNTLIILCLIVSALVYICLLRAGTPWNEALQQAPLLGLSAQTTAGFSTTAVAKLDNASKATLLLAMFSGGTIGSTAGGIKILRLLIILRFIQVTLVRTCLPKHAVLHPRLGGRRLESRDILEPFCLISLFIAVIFCSWIIFLFMGYEPLDSLFEVVSATGTVGLSAGLSGPGLPPLLKGVLCLDMLLGRLEIIAWIVLIYPKTWFGKRSEV